MVSPINDSLATKGFIINTQNTTDFLMSKLGCLMSEEELDRIIREVISIHRRNYLENSEKPKSKLNAVKDVIERNMNRMHHEN